MARYEYCDLVDEHDIRLLIILGGPSGTPLRCTFRHVSLDSLPFPYEAFSYCWGELKFDHQIYHVNETTKALSTLHVTKNLHDAVRNLQGNHQKKYAVWIDGVCINQNNDNERSRQVRLMKRIYKSAFVVHIWLGEPADNSALAIRILKELAREWRGQEEEPNAHDTFQSPSTCLLQWQDEEHASVAAFLHRPWFSRIWCIQEAASTPPAIAHCGIDSILYNDMVFIASRINLKGAINAFYSIKGLFRIEYPGILQTRMVQHYWQLRHMGRRITLAELLGWTHDYGSTEDRDRIYALLGLAMDDDDPLLVPNYKLPLEEVYLRTATCLIVNRKCLGLLYGLGLPRLPSPLPSWVPSFHGPKIVNSFDNFSQLAKFNACASRQPDIILEKDTNVLSVLGVPIRSPPLQVHCSRMSNSGSSALRIQRRAFCPGSHNPRFYQKRSGLTKQQQSL